MAHLALSVSWPLAQRQRAALVGLCTLCAVAMQASVLTARVKVRAHAHFRSLTTTADPALGHRISGRLVDDRGKPIRGARTTLRSTKHFQPCIRGSNKTADDGTFCWLARTSKPTLVFPGNEYFAAISQPVVSGNGPTPELELGVRSGQRLVLDDGPFEFEVRINAGTQRLRSLAVALRLNRDGKHVLLGVKDDASTDRPVTFVVPSDALGVPGRVDLEAFIPNQPRMSPTTESIHLLRRVTMTVPDVDANRALNGHSATDGFALRVEIASNDTSPVTGGWVEVAAAGTRVGTARVVDGVAAPFLKFRVQGDAPMPIRVEFLPGDSDFVSTAPLSLILPPPARPPWRIVALLAAAIACLFWVLRNWWRPPSRISSQNGRAEHAPVGIEHVKDRQNGPGRWTGQVLDAHTGKPVQSALVQVVAPTLHSRQVLARSQTNSTGGFELSVAEVPEGAQLTVTADAYSKLQRSMPAPGRFRIGIVQRRRAMLDRLVSWSVQQYASVTEPTPNAVQKQARIAGDVDVARWAGQIELAAYGDAEPTEADETRLSTATPARGQGAQDKR